MSVPDKTGYALFVPFSFVSFDPFVDLIFFLYYSFLLYSSFFSSPFPPVFVVFGFGVFSFTSELM